MLCKCKNVIGSIGCLCAVYAIARKPSSWESIIDYNDCSRSCNVECMYMPVTVMIQLRIFDHKTNTQKTAQFNRNETKKKLINAITHLSHFSYNRQSAIQLKW